MLESKSHRFNTSPYFSVKVTNHFENAFSIRQCECGNSEEKNNLKTTPIENLKNKNKNDYCHS